MVTVAFQTIICLRGVGEQDAFLANRLCRCPRAIGAFAERLLLTPRSRRSIGARPRAHEINGEGFRQLRLPLPFTGRIARKVIAERLARARR